MGRTRFGVTDQPLRLQVCLPKGCAFSVSYQRCMRVTNIGGAGVGSNDNSMGRLATVRERVREHILFFIFGRLEMLHIMLKVCVLVLLSFCI